MRQPHVLVIKPIVHHGASISLACIAVGAVSAEIRGRTRARRRRAIGFNPLRRAASRIEMDADIQVGPLRLRKLHTVFQGDGRVRRSCQDHPQAATGKFSERFRKMEALAESRGLNLSALTLSEMDELWEEVKRRPSKSVVSNQ